MLACVVRYTPTQRGGRYTKTFLSVGKSSDDNLLSFHLLFARIVHSKRYGLKEVCHSFCTVAMT